MVTDRLAWAEPGRMARKRSAPWAEILEPLRARPGDRAAVATYDGDALESLIVDLGGTTVPASADDPKALPIDLSFGEGPPLLAAAEPQSVARLRREEFLPGVVEDARRLVGLWRRASGQ